jgi:hypothetical protein
MIFPSQIHCPQTLDSKPKTTSKNACLLSAKKEQLQNYNSRNFGSTDMGFDIHDAMQIYKVNQSLEEHQSYYNLIIAD